MSRVHTRLIHFSQISGRYVDTLRDDGKLNEYHNNLEHLPAFPILFQALPALQLF